MTISKKDVLPLLKQAFADWNEDHATRLAAALAYYTMLSLAPLLIFTVKFIGVWYRNSDDARDKVTHYLQQFMGPQAAGALQAMTEKASQPNSGMISTIIGVVLLLFSAGGVFGELQDSMNVVWEVKPKPDRNWKDIVRQRFFSLSLVLGTAFILLASLVVSTVLTAIVGSIGAGWFWAIVNFVVSLVVVTGLFALIFKYLPDVKIAWKPVLYGAGLTGILFTIGKFGLGWYLGKGSTISVYGAAGSLAAVLIWSYYMGCILFFGAEFTQALAKAEGQAIVPSGNAVKMTEEERVQRGSPHKQAIEHAAAEFRPMPSDRARPAVLVPQVDRRKTLAFSAAGLAAGAVLGGVSVLIMERSKISPELAHKRAEDIDDRIRELEQRVDHVRKARVSAIEHYIDHFKTAHSTNIRGFLKNFATETLHSIKDRIVRS